MDLRYILLISAIVFTSTISAQKPKVRKSMNNLFTEHYYVSETDTSVWDGKYELYYKSHLIEKGRYSDGEKAGIWTFYNLSDFFELQYDFTKDSVLRIGGSEYHAIRNYIPPLFLGSPLVPYLYISSNVTYPLEAINKGIEGKVVLSLVISDEGEIIGNYISESLNKMMDNVVLKAIEKLPDNWKWLPAKRNGIRVESFYNITIHFDLE